MLEHSRKPRQHHKGVNFDPMTYTKDNIVFVEKPTFAFFRDLEGERFERLIVIGYGGRHKNNSMWFCECECDQIILVSLGNLSGHRTLSCGCLHKERTAPANSTHGLSTHPLYNTWSRMWARCTNPNNNRFDSSGGRGILVCDRWQSFEYFLADMGEKPKGLSLERKNVNGNYCSENCIWANDADQQSNRRNNLNVTYQDRTQTLTRWCRELGLSYDKARYHIYKVGRSVDEVFTAPAARTSVDCS